MRIALVDYRAGNLTSVRKALAAVGAEAFSPGQPEELEDAAGVIVPGVGHFNATAVLDERWRAALLRAVERRRPLLGICLGLQFLFEGSDEAPGLPGLGLLAGRCWLLSGRDVRDVRIKVPHVGWNSLDVRRPSSLLAGVPDGAHAYFTHSYVAPVTEDAVATTTHGETFASAVEREFVFGAQFHPEKSGDVGLALLRNFCDASRR